MVLLDFIYTYFTSDLTLVVLAAIYGTLAALLLPFRLKREDSALRSRILMSIFFVVVLGWGFLGVSFVLCNGLLFLYEAMGDAAVGVVLGLAIISALVIAVPVTVIVTGRLPDLLSAVDVVAPNDVITEIAAREATKVGLDNVTIIQSSSEVPFAYTIGSATHSMVVSTGLVNLLDKDEMDGVITHELAHVKNADTRLKVLLSVYRKLLFFDPVLRFAERSLHREREFAADEFSARVTGKPLSLASALVKISSSYRDAVHASSNLSIAGDGSVVNVPKVRERVIRLLKIADEIGQSEARRA